MGKRVKVLLFFEQEQIMEKLFSELSGREPEMSLDKALSMNEAEQQINGNTYDVIISNADTFKKAGTVLQERIKDKGESIPFLFINDNGGNAPREPLVPNTQSCVISSDKADSDSILNFIRMLSEKRAQDALEQSKELLEAIFSSLSDSVAVTDLSGCVVKVNRATLNIHGYEDESEVIGKNALEFIHESHHERARNNMARTLEDGVVKDLVYLLLRKDGSTFYGELTANLLRDRDGRPAGFVAITKDVTERKKREDEVRWLYDAIGTAMAGIATVDRHCVVNFVNTSFAHMWKYEEKEALGRDLSAFFLQEAVELVKDLKRMAFENRVEEWHGELTGRKKDGSSFEVLTYITPYLKINGEIQGFLGSFVDISGRKKLEKELGEKVRDIEAFGHIIAHDLKTPLITIKEFSRLLAEDIGEKLTEEERDILSRIVASSGEAFSMIEDLRKYFIIDRERNNYEMVNLKEVIDQVLDTLTMEYADMGITIEVAPDLPSMVIRPAAFFHVFYNLLDNAVKFGAKNIRIEHKEENDLHRFSVIDDGWGIEGFFLNKIFNIFSRSPRSKREKGGTGIGLAVVKRLIERHNGRIWVESEEGLGSTFFFEIPASTH